MNEKLIRQGKAAKAAARLLAGVDAGVKSDILTAMADGLMEHYQLILDENRRDTDGAKARGISDAMLDRLTLTQKRIEDMAEGMRQVARLPDPVGEVLGMTRRPNGLLIGKTRVPLGVIGIIYEARPNVTADAAALCIKAGNAVILRGGSEAIHSNTAIVRVMKQAGETAGLPEGALSLVEDTARETAAQMMRLNGYIDVLIPRGGAGLIASVVQNATVPVIETGTGNCHVYLEETAEEDMAREIVVNAKVSRPSVCNAAETLLVDEAAAQRLLPGILSALEEKNVALRGCERTRAIYPKAAPAEQADWETEYNDYILAVRVVSGIGEALDHIAKYGTGHSEAIVTGSYDASQRFLKQVDAAAVYVNASTRFTDGFEFGFGAEIGISTQKMHARGPMGLAELTTTKYIIYGNGQIR